VEHTRVSKIKPEQKAERIYFSKGGVFLPLWGNLLLKKEAKKKMA